MEDGEGEEEEEVLRLALYSFRPSSHDREVLCWTRYMIVRSRTFQPYVWSSLGA